MKKRMTLALAAAIFTLTLSAFPLGTAASTTTTPAPTESQMRKAGGSNVVYLQVILATSSLLSVLLP